MIAVKIGDACALAAKGETSGVVGALENTGAYEKCEFHEGGIETAGIRAVGAKINRTVSHGATNIIRDAHG